MRTVVVYRFGEFTLDTEQLELCRGADPVSVEPQVFALLTFLIENRGHVVSRDDLIAGVWQGRIVSDATLNSRVNSARRAIGDDGKAQALIRTYPKRGFRFVGDVRIDGEQSAATAEIKPDRSVASDLHRPSLLVLPFRNLSGDKSQSHLADGFTEDILTTLAKISQIRVVSRNATFAYFGHDYNVEQIAVELGVQHVLEGSVRRDGNRLRVSAQLMDCSDGVNLWADRYDREIVDVFALYDEIALKIAAELQVQLLEGEMARLRSAGTTNVAAWETYMRAVACTRTASKESYATARRLAERAIELDPSYAAAVATLAWVHGIEARSGWSKSRESSIKLAREFAEQAMALDPTNAEAHGVLGIVDVIEGRHDQALTKIETALDLSPNHADLVAYMAVAHLWNGQPEIAIGMIEKAMHLSPIYPPWFSGVRGFALRLVGRYDEAIAAFQSYSEREPAFGHVDLTIIYIETGQIELARQEAAEVLRNQGDFNVAAWAKTQLHRTSAPLNRDVAALRKAGLPG